MRSSKYPTRYRVGILDGKDIYLHPQLGLSIEQDHCLRGMTPKKLEAWFRQEQDVKMLAEIEARREEELEEIGHDRAYGRPHLPMIIRRENA